MCFKMELPPLTRCRTGASRDMRAQDHAGNVAYLERCKAVVDSESKQMLDEINRTAKSLK